MKEIDRRDFLKKSAKVALSGAAALSLGSVLANAIPGTMKVALGGTPGPEFDVYNGINPNAKDIVAHTFKDCLAKKWWPGICYKTSKPMVAAAAGTVAQIMKMDDLPTSHAWRGLKEEPNAAKGFLVRVSHGTGYKLFYLHLEKPKVKPLQKVKRGQMIGYPDKRWNMPRVVFISGDESDPNNYGIDHGFMTYWDGSAGLDIGKEEREKRFEMQQQILNKIAGMVGGPKKYTLLRKSTRACFNIGGRP